MYTSNELNLDTLWLKKFEEFNQHCDTKNGQTCFSFTPKRLKNNTSTEIRKNTYTSAIIMLKNNNIKNNQNVELDKTAYTVWLKILLLPILYNDL